MHNYEKVIIGKNKASAGNGNLGVDYFIGIGNYGTDFTTTGYSGIISNSGILYGLKAAFANQNPPQYDSFIKIDLISGDLTSGMIGTNSSDGNFYNTPASSFALTSEDDFECLSLGFDRVSPNYFHYIDFSAKTVTRKELNFSGYFWNNPIRKKYLVLIGVTDSYGYQTNGNIGVYDLDTSQFIWRQYFAEMNNKAWYGPHLFSDVSAEDTDLEFNIGVAGNYGYRFNLLSGFISKYYAVKSSDGGSTDWPEIRILEDTDYGMLSIATPGKFGSSYSYHIVNLNTNTILSTGGYGTFLPVPSDKDYLISYGADVFGIGMNFGKTLKNDITNTLRMTMTYSSSIVLTNTHAKYFEDGVLLFGMAYDTSNNTNYGRFSAFIPHDNLISGTFGNFTITVDNVSCPPSNVLSTQPAPSIAASTVNPAYNFGAITNIAVTPMAPPPAYHDVQPL